jgi:hypothetical protein
VNNDILDFFKTAAPRQSQLIGAAAGAGTGLGIHLLRTRGKTTSNRQKQLKVEIAKQKIEVKNNPSPRNLRRLKLLEIQHSIAEKFKKYPAASAILPTATGAIVGAGVGPRVAPAIRKMKQRWSQSKN